MTSNEFILATIANIGMDETRALVTEWCNASEVEISETGDIWIANPQAGHWLGDERKAEFVAWCERL